MQLPNIKNIRFNLSVLLWVVLLIILLSNAWSIRSALHVVARVEGGDLGIQTTRSVRINFESFDPVLARVENAGNFQPVEENIRNPFLTPPEKGE